MLAQGIANPDQLAILTKAVRDYCLIAHIEPGPDEYVDVSRQVIDLFERGLSGHNERVKALRADNRLYR